MGLYIILRTNTIYCMPLLQIGIDYQLENDAVIITHLIDKGKKEVYTRGGSAHRSFYGFYHSRYSDAHSSGYSSTSKTVRLETHLYDIKTEKLMWSVQSKTWSKDSK